MQIGVIYAAAAYVVWGLFPLYFKTLQQVSSLEVLAHRIVWAMVFLLIVMTVRRQWSWIFRVQRKVLAASATSSVLLAVNWYIFIWAVNHDHVIDASLGYFMTPLVNVLLGLLLLRERLRPAQWLAIGLAGASVAWLTWQAGHLPWISLTLAISFGFYGLMRKTAELGTLEGLSLETFMLFPVAFAFLAVQATNGNNAFIEAPASLRLLIAAAGPITAVPLLLFAAGARRIRMATLGLLQYIAPTLSFFLGIWLYHEPFNAERMTGFAMIWMALAVYSAEGLWQVWFAKGSAKI